MPTTDIAVAADKAAAVVPEKPLSPTQQKNLKEILEGDFADLREQTAYEINRQLNARLAEIDEEYGDQTKVQRARTKLQRAAEKAQTALQKVADEVEQSGVTLHGGYERQRPGHKMFAVQVYTDSLLIQGKEEAEVKARRAAQNIKATADLVINRRYREAQRQVLLCGITAPTAAEIVNDLPDADVIISEVTAALATNNEADVKELHLDQ